MKRLAALVCAAALFAGTAGASDVKVEAVKGQHVANETITYTVKNGETYPIDVCLSDGLTGPVKVELSPFTLEKFDQGQWSPETGGEVAVHFSYELRSGDTQSYSIHILNPGRYRLVLQYGRAVPDGKGCDNLFHGLVQVVRSKAFDVQ